MTAARVRLDLCVLADPRQGDMASVAHAAGIGALAALGYRIGLLALCPQEVPVDTGAMDPAWAALLDGGQVVSLSPLAVVEARVALCLDSRLMAQDVLRQGRLVTGRAIVTVERPAHLSGLTARGLEAVARRAEAVLGAPVVWAPGSVLARDALAHLAPHWPVTAEDWPLCLPDGAAQPRAGQRTRPVAGRARIARVRGRNDLPDPALLADPRIAWRLRLGPDAAPPPWPQAAPVEVWPDTAIGMDEFLALIDVLALPDDPADDPCPVEALMAIAAGAVPLLDAGYRPVFGAAALYAQAEEVPRKLAELHDDQALRDRALQAGQTLLQRLHQPAAFAERLVKLIGPPRADAFAPAILARPRRPVLFYSTNGVGMGHLTRQLAIARRLPPDLSPVFISHSQAVEVVRQFGYPAEHLPHHMTYRERRSHWNAALSERVEAALAFWQPGAVVFDGNIPYLGLLEALLRRPEIGRAWIRRGMWGMGRDPEALEQSAGFDLILEPGEVADVFDLGPTADRKAEALQLAPVRLLDEADLPGRDAACAELGLDPAAVNVLVAPGSGNNAGTQGLADRVIAALACRPGIGVALAEWRIATTVQSVPAGVVRLTDYPFARHIRAFDFAVAAAGYNTFAEHLSAALPTIWVPNEAPEQDQQILRARFATERGLGLTLRLTEEFLLGDALSQMLNAEQRSRFAATGQDFAATEMASNGAYDAADAVAALCQRIVTRAA